MYTIYSNVQHIRNSINKFKIGDPDVSTTIAKSQIIVDHYTSIYFKFCAIVKPNCFRKTFIGIFNCYRFMLRSY